MRHSPHPLDRRRCVTIVGSWRPLVSGSATCWSPCRWQRTSVWASPPSTCNGPPGSACGWAAASASSRPTWPRCTTSVSSPTVGCPVYGNEAAALFGDDIAFRADSYDIDLAGFPALVFLLRRAGSGSSAFRRAQQAARVLAAGGQQMVEQMASHCAAAGRLAEQLGLGPEVRTGIEQSYARWDGRGVPQGVSGEELALSARISQLADACEVIQRSAGVQQAVDVAMARSGTQFDPQVVAAIRTDPESLFAGLDEASSTELLVEAPVERPALTSDQLDHALEAIGDFCDLRCPMYAGHARGTAELRLRCRGPSPAPDGRGSDHPPRSARPRRRAVRRTGIALGQGGTPHRTRDRTDADARLLRRADLQPTRAAPSDRAAGRPPITSAWMAAAITVASAAPSSRCRPGCSPLPTPTTR